MLRAIGGMRLARAGLLLFVVGLWQLLWVWGLPAYVLSPIDILKHFFAALGSEELYQHIGASLLRSLPGFAIGALLGIALGLLAGIARAFEQMLSPVVFLTYPVPKIVMLPLFMLWFGIGDLSKILIIALACFYPMYINAYYGAKSTSALLVWSALNLGADRRQVFRKVVVPSALPLIFAGLRVSLALSFIVMFATEMINASSGLGHLIRAAESGLRFDLMYVSLATIAIIAYEFGLFLFRADRLMEAWYSLYRALGGFALAAVVGVALGMLMGRSRLVAAMLEPLFSGTYAVPKLALFPIFIFVFGIGSLSKVALVFLECLYPMVIITSQGARNVNRVLLWSAQNMGASRGDILRRIVIPATAPFIFAGFRVALPVAMIVVVITEMISSADGLGYQVIISVSSLKTDRMLAIVVVIALLGWLLDRALVVLRDRLVYWEKLETYYV